MEPEDYKLVGMSCNRQFYIGVDTNLNKKILDEVIRYDIIEIKLKG